MNEHEKQVIAAFLSWFEDNFGEEEWLDPDFDENKPDGVWRSYLELPEYVAVAKLFEGRA